MMHFISTRQRIKDEGGVFRDDLRDGYDDVETAGTDQIRSETMLRKGTHHRGTMAKRCVINA